MSAPYPFAQLEPHQVLQALDALGLPADGRMLQLNSYENRVFQAHLDDGRVAVAKFYRPGRWSDAQILEEHQFAQQLAAAEVPVVPPWVLSAATAPCSGEPPTLAQVDFDDGTHHRVAVCARHAGRGPELEDPATLRWLGRFLGRLHHAAGSRVFQHRRTLQPQWARDAMQRVVGDGLIDDTQRGAWLATCEQALDLIDAAFLAQRDATVLRLHGDFHPGNVMWRETDESHGEGGPHVVDLDDACNGPAVQDLWMLLSGDEQAMRMQLQHLLEGYRLFRDFDPRELALIEPLRTLRMVCHSAWIAERWGDPAFPIAFPWFGSPSYWAQQTTVLREQIALMREPPRLL